MPLDLRPLLAVEHAQHDAAEAGHGIGSGLAEGAREARPLPAGSVITAADLAQGEVDLAEDASSALVRDHLVLGRTLARPVAAGQGLRQAHLKARHWFAAGETVQVVASGPGFRAASVGQALTQGVEGQAVRVRTEGGRVLTGMPVAERRVEVSM